MSTGFGKIPVPGYGALVRVARDFVINLHLAIHPLVVMQCQSVADALLGWFHAIRDEIVFSTCGVHIFVGSRV